MNNVEDLTRELEREYLNDIVASMLTDALMEEKDMLRSEADKHVTYIRENGRILKDLQTAGELFSSETYFSFVVSIQIYTMLAIPPGIAPALRIEAGDMPPRAIWPTPEVPEQYWEDCTIMVGASWCWGVYHSVQEQHKKRRKAESALRKSENAKKVRRAKKDVR